MSLNAVEVKNITKIYKLYEDKWGPIKEVVTRRPMHKEFPALKDVSLDFPSGESIGVLGKNGSGKSTLLKIITGIAEPTSGTVEVNGSLVFLDVSSGIDAEMTGYENIFMKGTLLGYSKEEMMEKVDDIIAFSELEEFINQPVKNYSSGMRAKLGFAISVNVNPDILIVDEALAVGDSVFREKCMRKMNEFKEEGKTIIFVSHDKNAVENFCTKAAWIHQGELIMYGDSKMVGSYYNAFMSGKQSMESIKAQTAFSHAIESIKLTTDKLSTKTGTKNTFTLTVKGYIYGNEDIDFKLAVRNLRTNEYIEVPVDRFPYEGKQSIPNSQIGKAGFSANIRELDETTFTPESYQVCLRSKSGEDLLEFPIYAQEVKGLDKANETGLNLRFPTSFFIKQNTLCFQRENSIKLEQQTNEIRFTDNKMILEGIAFARGHQVPDEFSSEVKIFFKEKSRFDVVETITETIYTEEITENPSFNPNGRNYNYAGFKASVDLSMFKTGIYDAYVLIRYNEGPELCVAMWASKHDQYDQEYYSEEEQIISVNTENKYVSVVVSNESIDLIKE